MPTDPPARTLLLTPGPLTTSARTRAAMDRDWGSRHGDFLALNARVMARLARLAAVADTHDAVPLGGSGTSAVEAAIGTLVPRDGVLLVPANGAYAERIVLIAERAGRRTIPLRCPEHRPVDPDAVERALATEPAITDVALVHCETSTGLLNPLEAVAALCARTGKRLHVDAMSALGCVPIDGRATPFASLAASSNKGLEGVPGLAFVLADRAQLALSAGRSATLTLDLHAQWRGFASNGQWRFTPPVQVIAALDAALDGLDAEGGVPARHARYRANHDVLVRGLRDLGFEPFLAAEHRSPVIVTFKEPPGFDFELVYDALAAAGIVIYPGKLTAAPSFRIGCIGQVFPDDMRRVVKAFEPFRPADAAGKAVRTASPAAAGAPSFRRSGAVRSSP